MNTFIDFLKSDDAKKIRKITPMILLYMVLALMIINGAPNTFIRVINLIGLVFIVGTTTFVIIKQYSIYKKSLK